MVEGDRALGQTLDAGFLVVVELEEVTRDRDMNAGSVWSLKYAIGTALKHRVDRESSNNGLCRLTLYSRLSL